jgi:hypothetical protein
LVATENRQRNSQIVGIAVIKRKAHKRFSMRAVREPIMHLIKADDLPSSMSYVTQYPIETV